MKYFLILFLINLINPILGDGLYKFRMIFNIEPITIELPDKSIFQVVSGKGGFTDNKGNFGDVQANGTREADKEKNLIGTNVLIILEKDNKNKFWGKAIRKNSDTDAGGGGIFQIIAGIGDFKGLVGKNCNYALAATENFTVMQDVICKP
tara:strand:- start:74 stop:523 length:450 start_codon:yes stop_codon:yes gene_type:complete